MVKKVRVVISVCCAGWLYAMLVIIQNMIEEA